MTQQHTYTPFDEEHRNMVAMTKLESQNCARHEQQLAELYQLQRDNTAAIAEQTRSLSVLQQVVSTLHDTVSLLSTDVHQVRDTLTEQRGASYSTREVVKWVLTIALAVGGWTVAYILKH